MIWLQDGSSVTWDRKNKCPKLEPVEELVTDEKKMINACAKEFSTLHEYLTPTSKHTAAENYAKIFKENNNEFYGLVFKLFSVCVLSKPSERLRNQLADVIAFMDFKLTDESDSNVQLLDSLLFQDLDTFKEAFTGKGGSEELAAHLKSISKCDRLDGMAAWRQVLHEKIETDFDQAYVDFLMSDIINTSNWLVSFILTFYFQEENPIYDQILDRVREFPVSDPSPEDLVMFSIMVRDRTGLVENAYRASTDVVFLAHLFDLASSSEMVESRNHDFDMQLVIMKLCEILIRDSDISGSTGQELGEKRWLACYLEVVGVQTAERVLRDVCPSLRNGLKGKVVNSINSKKEKAVVLNKDDSILDRIREAKEKDERCGNEDWKKTAKVLNREFLESVEWLQNEVIEACRNSDGEPIFDQIKGLDGKVIVAMLKRRIDREDDEIKPQIEQLMFQYIMDNAEMP